MKTRELSSSVKRIEPPDIHYLRAAEGWLALGNYVEAVEELRKISVEWRFHPLVLLTHWEIHALARQWGFAHVVAHAMVVLFPEQPVGWINASYALHQMQRTEEAWTTLLPAAGLFPRNTIIAYNLACYACQLGRKGDAKEWLDKAILLGDAERVRRAALRDPDLKALWF